MGKPNIPSIAELNASGALGGSVERSNVASSAASGPSHSEAGGMEGGGHNVQGFGERLLAAEGQSLEVPGAGGGVGETLNFQGMDTMLDPFNKGGGAFNNSLIQKLGDSADFLITPQGKGENIDIRQLGEGERQSPPNVQGDLQLNKGLSAKGGGASQAG